MTIQANIQAVQDAYDAVKNHCMCARISDNGCVIEIQYPAGDWPMGINGICATYGQSMGKADALKLLLSRMERDWLDSFPSASR